MNCGDNLQTWQGFQVLKVVTYAIRFCNQIPIAGLNQAALALLA
jgi:hypothetical protein